MSIRGMAGMCAVRAQNFAPGTTAADIESALAPVGGNILSCRLIASTPTVIAEIIFEGREGAENVVQTFNNQPVSLGFVSLYIFQAYFIVANKYRPTDAFSMSTSSPVLSHCLPVPRLTVPLLPLPLRLRARDHPRDRAPIEQDVWSVNLETTAATMPDPDMSLDLAAVNAIAAMTIPPAKMLSTGLMALTTPTVWRSKK